MKACQLGRKVRGTALTRRWVSFRPNLDVYASVKSSAAMLRHRRFSCAYMRPALWTEHSLHGTTSSVDDLPPFPKAHETTAGKHQAYVALGSNLGDRIGWIEQACNAMSRRGIKVKRTSCLWETEPMYVTDQEAFINGACEVSRCR